MADGNGITSISLNGVRKLIEDRSLPEDILDIFGKISGVVIALPPLVGGAPPGIRWPLLEPKDALVDAGKAAIKRITRSQPRDYLDQARRFTAASTLLTFSAYFDALRICEPELMAAIGLGEEDKRRIASQAAAHAEGRPPLGNGSSLTAQVLKIPHPANPHDPASAESRRGTRRLHRTPRARGSRKERPVMGGRKPNGRSSIYNGTDGKWRGWVTMGVKSDGTPTGGTAPPIVKPR